MALVAWVRRCELSLAVAIAACSAGCGQVERRDNPDGGGTVPDAGDPDEPADAAPPSPACEPGGNPTYEEAWSCLEEAYCRLVTNCFVPYPLEQCLGFGIAFYAPASNAIQIERVREAIAEGIIEYHPDRVADCVAAFGAAECRVFGQADILVGDLCPIFTGSIADGEPCFDALECATPGAVCGGDSACEEGALCCLRTCIPPADLAESCADRDCVLGAHCIDGLCRPGETGSPCALPTHCDLDFWCDPSSGTCQPDAALDGACAADEQCPWPQTCLGDDLGQSDPPSGTCGRSDRPGDPCDVGCFYNLTCKPASMVGLGTCVRYGEEGDGCVDVECGPELRCGPDVVCIPRSREGESCSFTSKDCLEGLRCVDPTGGGTTGVCAALAEVGERCATNDDCVTFLCDAETRLCGGFPGCHD